MRKVIVGVASVLALTFLLFGAPVIAQQSGATDKTESAQKAMAALQRMADFCRRPGASA